MTCLLGFLSVIAVELLQLTYLQRTQPTALNQCLFTFLYTTVYSFIFAYLSLTNVLIKLI